MDDAFNSQAHARLQQWFATPPGALVAAAEADAYRHLVSDLFGYHLVQVGRLGGFDLIGSSRILHRVLVDIFPGCMAAPAARARVSASVLPFAADSIDVLLLPHVLEFEPRPHDALREVFRVLVPDGHLVISVFNPWSVLGVRRVFLRHRQQVPWCGQFLGLARIKDWLALLGFDLVSVEACFFMPPLRSAGPGAGIHSLTGFMRRMLPYLGGSHVLLARKRVATLTPIRPRWVRSRRLVSVGLAEPSARTVAQNDG